MPVKMLLNDFLNTPLENSNAKRQSFLLVFSDALSIIDNEDICTIFERMNELDYNLKENPSDSAKHEKEWNKLLPTALGFIKCAIGEEKKATKPTSI